MVAALVVLAGRLPGDAELGGDFWPPNAEFDGVVDQRREFGFCPHLRNAGAPDPFQDLHWDIQETWCVRLGDSTGATCCRSGRPCLALGLDWRFGLLMRSMMRRDVTIWVAGMLVP